MFLPHTTTTSAFAICSGGKILLTPRPSSIPASPAPSQSVPLVVVPSIFSKSRLVISCITPKFPEPFQSSLLLLFKALAVASKATSSVTSLPLTLAAVTLGSSNIYLFRREHNAPLLVGCLVSAKILGKSSLFDTMPQASGQSKPQVVFVISKLHFFFIYFNIFSVEITFFQIFS